MSHSALNLPDSIFQPQAQDILTDLDLLELFRVIQHIIRKNPDSERLAKLYYCIVYALGDSSFHKPQDSDHIFFKSKRARGCVQLPSSNDSMERPIESRDRHVVRPYTQMETSSSVEHLMEPNQRGFYYEDGRISRESVLLQRYAEQGILTQASLLEKRKQKIVPDSPLKKPKIPHRNGGFEQRRDDIINRMRTVMLADLERKAQHLPSNYSLAIEKVSCNDKPEQWLSPALKILTRHSNMKPHQDDGMNQNGIYYNNDYFRLYLAFVQFQEIFARLFPTAGDKNANMKVYRSWIEPHLTDTNWAAFRRNVMVGERMMQLTRVVGQGVLLITKELSGSKIHLSFTNFEWEQFIQGLSQGRWDKTIDWSHEEEQIEGESESLLVNELRYKFATHLWFTEQGTLVPLVDRKAARAQQRKKN